MDVKTLETKLEKLEKQVKAQGKKLMVLKISKPLKSCKKPTAIMSNT